MTDTDSYLLKCALEELDKQFPKPLEEINAECACKYGYSEPQQDLTTNQKEEKNDN